ncbi:MreB/Mbl family ATPase [Citrifermentans bemidjiense Bem]|uniref:MreB/Mbl family ATPase n=1 Tax=Citrifermentans bemidjiense (strain ATCC BAA-1014 / DSM 16622 / JCM 12645 / Bem) TaxID=404380 RepID=B5EI68_CITBB|nr:rod shape-determining protein [Citrifermentans bemidjiense]ACH38332.1 MreB/Mbl family ATPase [Citrifermentans bemidjiense Bem]
MIPLLKPTYWRPHVALDVGTATTRIAAGSRLMEQPSMIGRKRALSGGVVVDGETAWHILKPLLDRARVCGIVKPCVLACAPSDARYEERQLLVDSIMRSGAASAAVIPEPLAAAIGAGIDVSSPYARMVVDIGEGVTDCAIISSSEIRACCAVRIGCARMRSAIVKNIGGEYGDDLADDLMRRCGLARSPEDAGSVAVAASIEVVLEEIAAKLSLFVRDLPAEMGCDVIDSGICLTGGGALIPGVRRYLEERIGISICVADNPRHSVVEGARAILPVMLMLNRWH